MSDYQTTLGSFQNFFSAIAQVDGALVGLVFVALTFNDNLMGSRGHPGLSALARQIFLDFLMVLVVALLMLLPAMPATFGGSLEFAGLGEVMLATIGIVSIMRSVVVVWRDSARLGDRRLLLQRFWLSLAGNASLLFSGLLALQGRWAGAAYWGLLISGVMMLMLSASRSAWLLVTHPRSPE